MSHPTTHESTLSRRGFLKTASALGVVAAAQPLLAACSPRASSAPLKIGVLLPYSDVYAALGESITEGMKMYFDETGNTAGGRNIQLVVEDEGTAPDAALQKARKLVEQDEVDLLTGVVSSGVLAALRDYLEASNKLLVCSNAGSNAHSRAQKSRTIWRTSFTNWMPNWPMGAWAAENVGKRAFVSVPDYAAGANTVRAFQNSFEAGGGTLVATQKTPFPSMGDAAPYIAEIAAAAPDFVYCFYSGGSAVTFVKAYADFGLAGSIPLLGSGFVVEEDVLPAEGDAALGALTGLHWALLLDNPENRKFTAAYKTRSSKDANVFAVQGYDTGRVIVEMLNAVQGNASEVDGMIEALSGVAFASPRGSFALDANSQAPRQHIYLREVQQVDGALHNVVIGDLGEVADPGDESKG